MQHARWPSTSHVSKPNPTPSLHKYHTSHSQLLINIIHSHISATSFFLLQIIAKLFVSVLFLLFSLSFAVREGSWQQGQCQIQRINAQQPSCSIDAEGGVTEFWDQNIDEFQCAGVSVHRHRLRPRALLLPLYHNAPAIIYILQGRGVHGLLVSGCPETYESSQSQRYSEDEGERGGRGMRRDRHQKVRQFREGDIIAVPAGAAQWAYNDGDQDLVVVVMQHNDNPANQLDQNPRTFFLAGNPERSQKQQQQYGQQGRRGHRHELGNIFRGFDARMLADVFQVDEETARNLQGQNDERGHIVIVERGLQMIRPSRFREQQQYGREDEEEMPYSANGIEETICSAKIHENINNPSRADIYNPRAGRFSTVNSLTLPILKFLQLSAARGVLYRNAIMAPHWSMNAHTIIYASRGEARMQIVNHRGQAVFDGTVRKGQVVVVPQYFAAVKHASEQGFEWIEMNTNGNAMINTLSGRTSAMRGLPASVIASAFQISPEQARRLKYSREETVMFSGRSMSERVATA